MAVTTLERWAIQEEASELLRPPMAVVSVHLPLGVAVMPRPLPLQVVLRAANEKLRLLLVGGHPLPAMGVSQEEVGPLRVVTAAAALPGAAALSHGQILSPGMAVEAVADHRCLRRVAIRGTWAT